MPRRQRRNAARCKQIGSRFVHLIQNVLGLSLKEAATILGYANPTTLYAIKNGSALPDPERLLIAVDLLKDKSGRRIDLNWIFTGEREPFLPLDSAEVSTSHDIIKLWNSLSNRRQVALRTLLEDV